MFRNDYQYFAELTATDGQRVADVGLDVDWVPALRYAELERYAGSNGAVPEASAATVIEPLWSTAADKPYVRGVGLHGNGEAGAPHELPVSYFRKAVTAATSGLVETGALLPSEPFDYRVYALKNRAGNGHAPPASPLTLDISAVDRLPHVEPLAMAPIAAAATRHAAKGATTAAASAPRLPVFIPQRVLDEATAASRAVEDIETGGILVGRLCRDPGSELFIDVTAQIPAEHATGTRESLRLTPATWVSVEAALRLRGLNEIALGWWHSHPFFCKACPPESRQRCPFSQPAFSAADCDVHREVFQQAFSIALLLSYLGDELPSYDVFGWQQGQIDAIDFHTVPDRRPAQGVSV